MNPEYFAFGSNLHAADFAEYCQRHGLPPEPISPLGPGWLPDHKIGFTTPSKSRKGGVLDILHAPGHVVPGGLFSVAPGHGWTTLDHKETVPTMYRRRPALVLDASGREHQVTTYEVVPEARVTHVPPHEDYVNVVRQGLRAFDLDHVHVDAATRAEAPQVPPVFVYGTLRLGHSAHHILASAGARPRGAATVHGRVGELRGHPALVLDPAAPPLAGEMWEVPPDRFGPLDEYECFGGFGVPGSLYRRAVTWAQPLDRPGRTLVWVYVHG